MGEPLVISVADSGQTLAAVDGLKWFAVGEFSSRDGRSEPVPARARMLSVRVAVFNIADSPTTLTCALARGSDGTGQLTNRTLAGATQALSFNKNGDTVSTAIAIAVWPLDEMPYTRRTGDTAGVLYVGLELDAGSCELAELELHVLRIGSER